MNSSLLLMAVMGLLFPAVLHSTRTELQFGKSELALSRFSSCVMLAAYAAFLYFQLRSQKNLYVPVNGVSSLASFSKENYDMVVFCDALLLSSLHYWTNCSLLFPLYVEIEFN